MWCEGRERGGRFRCLACCFLSEVLALDKDITSSGWRLCGILTRRCMDRVKDIGYVPKI